MSLYSTMIVEPWYLLYHEPWVHTPNLNFPLKRKRLVSSWSFIHPKRHLQSTRFPVKWNTHVIFRLIFVLISPPRPPPYPENRDLTSNKSAKEPKNQISYPADDSPELKVDRKAVRYVPPTLPFDIPCFHWLFLPCRPLSTIFHLFNSTGWSFLKTLA